VPSPSNTIYPSPGRVGGALIRQVIRTFKEEQVSLPLEGRVLIAVSGGVDSMVLAHLLGRYGRKVVASGQITLLHLDHGWRPESAREEPDSVRHLAEALGLRFLSQRLPAPRGRQLESRNLEEDARLKRQKIFRTLTGSGKAYSTVLTAHHLDDQAETVLFRFLRGELLELGGGILFRDDRTLRPFLQVSKAQIRAYAAEEGLEFHEDPTNSDPRRFRAWARGRVFPLLEEHFPAVRDVLAAYPGRLNQPSTGKLLHGVKAAIELAIGRPLGRAQVDELRNQLSAGGRRRALSLPGGVRLRPVKQGFLIENLDLPDQG
jgi:tRNA(Ile)-lysidine synthetase-like protein